MKRDHCEICNKELAEYHVNGDRIKTCSICEEMLYDVMVYFFDIVARNHIEEISQKDVPIIFEKIKAKLDFESAIEQDEDRTYFERFRMVLDWLNNGGNNCGTDKIERFLRCKVCGSDMKSFDTEKFGNWVRFYCKNCNHILSRHYILESDI